MAGRRNIYFSDNNEELWQQLADYARKLAVAERRRVTQTEVMAMALKEFLVDHPLG